MTTPVTPIDYSSRDYASLRASLLAYAAQAFPQWTPSSEGDFGVLMVELLAYMGDVLSYYVDRAQYESYLPTATQLQSVLNIAQMLGYLPGSGQPATASVDLVLSKGLSATVVPKGTKVATDYINALDGPVIFETAADVTLPDATSAATTTAVSVVEGQTQVRPDGTPIIIATSNGLPDQAYRLPVPKVYQDSIEVYVNGTAWTQVDHLVTSGDSDQVYSLTLDASGYTSINFGDAINGAIPAVGLPIGVVYRVGYGSAGNVPAGAITTLYDNTIIGVSVKMIDATHSTSTAASGGADPETIEQIRANAPKAFASQSRAVTLQDFINVAVSVPGVSKANAIANYWTNVIVYVLGPGGGAPTSALLSTAQQKIQAAALAGVSVTTLAPSAVTIKLVDTTNSTTISNTQPTIYVDPTASNSVVAHDVIQAIQDFIAGVNIGAQITVADLYYKIMGVDGVRWANFPLLARADASLTGTGPIQMAANEYAVLDVAGLTANIEVTGGI